MCTIKTALGPDGHLWSVSQRLNLDLLGRLSVVTRSDEVFFDQPSYCLKEGMLTTTPYADALQAAPVTYLLQTHAWPLESLTLTSAAPNINRQGLCQTQSLVFALSDTLVCTGGCITARVNVPDALPPPALPC